MDRYMTISSDGHAGAQPEGYRPYFDAHFRAKYDEALAAAKVAREQGRAVGLGGTRVESYGKNRRAVYGAATAVKEQGADGAWDPHIRARELDRDGLAGEVIFCQGTPFRAGFPATKFDPTTGQASHPYEIRAAGSQAYNRWLADFCSVQSERHAGAIAVDVDDPVAASVEIRRARKSGLWGGVNLPVMHLEFSDPDNFYHNPRYEPIWAACEELEVPVTSHAFGGTPSYGELPGTRWINSTEIFWVAHRLFWMLIWGGVLERHPKLNVVVTESTGSWLPHMIALMDDFYLVKNHEEISKIIPHPPSFYWNRQCHIGASPPFGRREVELREDFGIDKIMWGSDYPHIEGTWPYTEQRMKAMFAGVPQAQTAAMLGGNAAKLYKFDVNKLNGYAARIGPRISDLSGTTPKQADEYWKHWVALPR